MAEEKFLSSRELLDEVLGMIRSFMNDREKLEKLHQYISDQLYEGEEDETVEIPEKYRSLVTEVADWVSNGVVCLVNGDTLEFISVPPSEMESEWDEDEEDDEEEDGEEEEEEEDEDEVARVYREWEHIIYIKPPPSQLSYSFMERFTNAVADGKMKSALQKALGGRGPFRHFNAIIHGSPLKKDWFAFRQRCLESYVFEALLERLPSEEE